MISVLVGEEQRLLPEGAFATAVEASNPCFLHL